MQNCWSFDLKLNLTFTYHNIPNFRNADKSQINKAYRKKAKEFHPDKFTDEADKVCSLIN